MINQIAEIACILFDLWWRPLSLVMSRITSQLQIVIRAPSEITDNFLCELEIKRLLRRCYSLVAYDISWLNSLRNHDVAKQNCSQIEAQVITQN
jgi:hypothetical protein